MSEMGQSRRFGDFRSMSAFARFADLTQSVQDVPQVPLTDSCTAANLLSGLPYQTRYR
jgi:hypothetical protein